MANPGNRPVSAVVADILGNVQEIVRSEMRLARAEIKEEMVKVGRPARLVAGGLGLAFYALGLLLVAAVLLLSRVVDPSVAAAVIGLVVSALAAALIMSGRRQFKQWHLRSQKTWQVAKESVSWMTAPNK